MFPNESWIDGSYHRHVILKIVNSTSVFSLK